MPPTASRARRLAALAAVGAALTLGAPAGAQQVAVGFAPGCGPGTGCGTARFFVGAPPVGLQLTSLALTFTGGPFRFVPNVAGGPSVGTYAAQDDLGAFGGFTAVGAGGVQLFADFLDTGDPSNPGLPFTLGGGSAGTFDVDVAPASVGGPFALTYRATLAGGGAITGTVTAIPEPSTAALLAPAALALAAAARRRRRAGGAGAGSR